ncbi:MAG TPA: thiamine pyrophosphate-dependent enzyme, partial [Longimicrobium sp.]|nr:thiamine pyrophosphate-dependent enzyme [Longimicrobium sp.]
LAYKASSYNMPAWTVDGMDVIAVEDAARKAVTEIRGGGGPVFLELRTYRFRAHSMYDPDLYRGKEEIEEWKARDPVATLGAALQAAGALDGDGLARMEAEAADEVEAAVGFAEAGTPEPVEELARFVTSVPPAQP